MPFSVDRVHLKWRGFLAALALRDASLCPLYISNNDMRAHFGLHDSSSIDLVEIHWPSGAVEEIALPATDRIFTIK